MRVKIMLETKLELLEMQSEELIRSNNTTVDIKQKYTIKDELDLIEENRQYLKKLIYSLTWENWVKADRI